jgi:ribosomal protein L15
MGDFSKKLSFKVAAASASAKEKIEKAGGDITLNPPLPKARPRKKNSSKAKKTGGKK